MFNLKKSHVYFDWIAIGIIMLVYFSAYTSVDYYNLLIKHAGIPMAISLVILFFNHIDWVRAIKYKEKELILLIMSEIIVLINMIFSRSGPGVLIDITNLLLLLYLSDKVKLDEKIYFSISVISFIVLLLWFGKSDAGYNANTSTTIVFEMTGLSVLGLTLFLSKYKKESLSKIFLIALLAIIVFPLAQKNNCRSIILGMGILFVLYYLFPHKLWTLKKLYLNCIIGLITISIIFPITYTILWKSYGITGPKILRAGFMGGREKVWVQYLTAFVKSPIAGIGNDFLNRIPDLRYNSVHNAYIHVLVVYGIPVFFLILYFLYKRLTDIDFNNINSFNILALCYLITILFISIVESYFAVSFGNQIFFLFLLALHHVRSSNGK